MTTQTEATEAEQQVLHRTYQALRPVVKTARDTARHTLQAGRLHPEVVDNAVRVISELVGNAVVATPRKLIVIHLHMAAGYLYVEVWDSSQEPPKRRAPALDLNAPFDPGAPDPGGWGLGVVDTLSTSCGYRLEPTGGKTVYARLSLLSPAEG